MKTQTDIPIPEKTGGRKLRWDFGSMTKGSSFTEPNTQASNLTSAASRYKATRTGWGYTTKTEGDVIRLWCTATHPDDRPERDSTTCTGRTEQITIRLDVERVAALRDGAKAGTRSLAQQVEHLFKWGDELTGENSLLIDENRMLTIEVRTLTDRCAELEAENADWGRAIEPQLGNRPIQSSPPAVGSLQKGKR